MGVTEWSNHRDLCEHAEAQRTGTCAESVRAPHPVPIPGLLRIRWRFHRSRMAKPIVAVLYARVSKSDGTQDPESQLAQLRQLAHQRGWIVGGEFVDQVSGDPARRGRTPPGLAQALQQISAGRAQVLAIFSADRLVRSAVHLLQLVQQIADCGGRVVSLQDGDDLDTTRESSELLTFLLGWRARMELRLIRQRTAAGLERARREGKTLGRPKVAQPDLDTVRELVLLGAGYREIAKRTGCTEHGARQALRQLAEKG